MPDEPAPPGPPGLARSTAIQAAGTLLSRLTGFGRLFAFAYALGASDVAGTYTLANNTPNSIYELVLGGVLSGTVLPVFVRYLRREETDPGGGWRAVSAVFSLAVAGSALLAVVFVVVAPWFIRLYTLRTAQQVGDDQVAVATDLLRLFAPQVFFYGLISLTTALLGARRRFAAPKFAPVLNNFVVIALFLAYPTVAGSTSLEDLRDDRGAILLLGLVTTAGVATMALAQFPFRLARSHLRWVWEPRHPAVREIVRLSGWTVAFVAANQVALFVVYFLANSRPGDVAVYFFAFTLFQLPHGVVSVSVTTAVQPELADRWSASDLEGFRQQLSLGLRSIAVILVPAAVGYVLLARPIVSALLEHGSLGEAAAEQVSVVLAVMAIGLPAYSAWYFLTSVYQAMGNTRALFLVYLVKNGVNIAGAVALYGPGGVRGLGLAFTLAYWAGTAAAVVDLRRRTGGVDGRQLARSVTRIAAAASVMGVVVATIAVIGPADEGVRAALRVGVAAVAGVTVYAAAARVFGVEELAALVPFRAGTLRMRRRQK